MNQLIVRAAFIVASLPFALVLPSEAFAGGGHHGGIHAHHRTPCPRCHTKCCKLNVEQVDVERDCWKVECETICIPNVVFPWQKDCCNPHVNNGARVKTVRVLKQHTYTCPACEYSWTPVDHGCCGVGCGNRRCGGCQGLPIDMGISEQQPVPVPQPPVDAEAAPKPPLPSPDAANPSANDQAGFVEHQKVNVVSFITRLLED